MRPTLSRRALLVSLLAARSVRAEAPLRARVLFHVAEEAGVPVAPASFVADQLAHAARIYGPIGLSLVDGGRRRLSGPHARLVTRADRDALATALRPRVVNCFVVAQLMDVDEPGRERRGVHWRARGDRTRHFVVVSRISAPWVLAHELGHFFGNQAHSETPGNLMSYEWSLPEPFLDAAQRARVRETAEAMIARGELGG